MANHKTEISQLSHAFGSGKSLLPVIENFELEIRSGEIVSILGPSGCGKSTILRCIAGFIDPMSGTIFIDGETPKVARNQKKVGFAFQNDALLEWRNVEQNITLPTTIGSISHEETAIKKRTRELIEVIGLKGFENFYPAQLSGGMRQRVSLARSILLKPNILLLDEPFGSLDLLTRSDLIVEFDKIMGSFDIPVIMVTHSVEEAVFLSDKVVILSPRPTNVVEVIEPNLVGERDYSLFDNDQYLKIVADCRKKLLEGWRNE